MEVTNKSIELMNLLKVAKDTSIENNIVMKNKLYLNLSKVNVKKLGLVAKKNGYDYISWTHMEIALKFLDPESDVTVEDSIYENMISLTVKYFGKEYKSFYPILDNTNQGAVMVETPLITALKEKVVTTTSDADGNTIGTTTVQMIKEQITFSKELVFWQSRTNSKQEGRKTKVTSMNINNSIQRGLSKEVARVTGFGISIFTGEDLIQYDEK